MTKRFFAILCIASGLFCVAQSVMAVPLRQPEVQVIDSRSNTVQQRWLAFDASYKGGLTVAVGDVDGDGVHEVIVAQSGGIDAHGIIKIFTAAGTLTASYPVFADNILSAELSLAVGNVDADEADEIVVGVISGQRSMVYVFDGALRFDADTVGAFESFPGVRAGVHVAVANVVGDKKAEIIVGSGKGVPSRVGIFNAQGKSVAKDIVPFDPADQAGVVVARLHNTEGYDDIAVAQPSQNTAVKHYRVDAAYTYPVVHETAGWSREFASGLALAGIDVTGDGMDELAMAPAGDQQTEIRVIDSSGASQLQNPLMVYEEDFRGGASLATGQLDADAQQEYVVVPHEQKKRADPNRSGKYIEVNLTTQIEYLWENGYLRNVFLISSGLSSTPSPEGEFSILKKYETHVYDGRPVYYFPNTPWNLMYKAGGPQSNYYFHTAYWHNNFGHPMSHGCINMKQEEAKFLFFWADIGTPAWLHK